MRQYKDSHNFGFYALLLLCGLLLFMCLSTHAQCPTEGKAKNAKEAQANRYKNREIIQGIVDTSVTLEKILAPGNDLNRFSPNSFVKITGYLVEVKPGGVESCNCKSKDKDTNDIHIYIGQTPNAPKTSCVIVEITPRFKWINKGFDVKQFVGKKVNVYGYLFYDEEHFMNAVNTCGKCTNNWRATVWEVHPVVKIELN